MRFFRLNLVFLWLTLLDHSFRLVTLVTVSHRSLWRWATFAWSALFLLLLHIFEFLGFGRISLGLLFELLDSLLHSFLLFLFLLLVFLKHLLPLLVFLLLFLQGLGLLSSSHFTICGGALIVRVVGLVLGLVYHTTFFKILLQPKVLIRWLLLDLATRELSV